MGDRKRRLSARRGDEIVTERMSRMDAAIGVWELCGASKR
jgi:hypothetical protein